MKSLHLVATLLVLLSIVNIPCKITAMDNTWLEQQADTPWNLADITFRTTLSRSDYLLIKKTTDTNNLINVLLSFANSKGDDDTYCVAVIDHAIDRVNQLEKEQNYTIRFKEDDNDQTIANLITHYDVIDTQHKFFNPKLAGYVEWFITHGIRPNKTAMRMAIANNRIDVVTILRKHGINPTDEASDSYHGQTFIEYADSRNKKTIKALLEAPATAYSTGWYTYLSQIAGRTEHADRAVLGGQRATTPDDLLDSLSKENDIPFQDAISQFNNAELQAVKTYLDEKKPQGYTQKIYNIDLKIASQAQAPSLSGRMQRMLSLVATAVTAAGFYQWFYRTSASGYSENVLINNTGKSIFVSNLQYEAVEIKPKSTYTLPATGTLKIKSDAASDQPDLEIDLTVYAANRAEHYLNIGISKNWLSWLFGPLRYSIHWVDKAEESNQ